MASQCQNAHDARVIGNPRLPRGPRAGHAPSPQQTSKQTKRHADQQTSTSSYDEDNPRFLLPPHCCNRITLKRSSCIPGGAHYRHEAHNKEKETTTALPIKPIKEIGKLYDVDMLLLLVLLVRTSVNRIDAPAAAAACVCAYIATQWRGASPKGIDRWQPLAAYNPEDPLRLPTSSPRRRRRRCRNPTMSLLYILRRF